MVWRSIAKWQIIIIISTHTHNTIQDTQADINTSTKAWASPPHASRLFGA